MSGQALTYDVSKSSYVSYRLRPWNILTTEKTEKTQRAVEAVLCVSLRSALRALWLKQKRKISSNQEIYREPFPISPILTLTPSQPRFSKSKHPMKTIHRMSGGQNSNIPSFHHFNPPSISMLNPVSCIRHLWKFFRAF